jgi:mRNA-degrading endonuclease RelE of RelBE toxin-antitoxin system
LRFATGPARASLGPMLQVTFSDQAMAELNRLPTLEQMTVVGAFSGLTAEDLASGKGDLGKVRREGHTYHRLRVGDFRVYFEAKGEALHAHFILHRNTFADFAFRSRLPVDIDEPSVEANKAFWTYLEQPPHDR